MTEGNEKTIYTLEGVFSKFTIPEYDKKVQSDFKASSPSALDLKGVTECDSAFVALLISYKKQYPDLRLLHAPEQLKRLLMLYNVLEWFD